VQATRSGLSFCDQLMAISKPIRLFFLFKTGQFTWVGSTAMASGAQKDPNHPVIILVRSYLRNANFCDGQHIGVHLTQVVLHH
jgi:hypothetical protein